MIIDSKLNTTCKHNFIEDYVEDGVEKEMIKIDRDSGTNLATGISLDLSDDGQPSDDSRREGGAF